MLSLGAEGSFDSQNIMSPAVARHDGKYYLFYAGGPAGPANKQDFVRYQIGLALSDDGELFRKTGKPLLELGERDNFHVTPSLLRDPEGDLLLRDGLWHMVYCGNRDDDVEHATSRDGLHWAKDPRSPIYRRAYSPNLIQTPAELRMYYIHKPQSSPWEVHLATGSDVYSLRPYAGNPVLKLAQVWEAKAIVYPYVLREGGTWVMFYAAYWNQRLPNGQPTAIGMATSPDGKVWTKNAANPVFTPQPDSTYDSLYTSSQAVIRDGDGYKMYYASRIDMIHKYYAIGLATRRSRLAPAGTH